MSCTSLVDVKIAGADIQLAFLAPAGLLKDKLSRSLLLSEHLLLLGTLDGLFLVIFEEQQA